MIKANALLVSADYDVDHYFFRKDKDRLYPAFGLTKVQKMHALRRTHMGEIMGSMLQAASGIASALEQGEREIDWAIAGGMAAGAGGIVAGAAAALDAQAKNVEIRQRNAERRAQAADIREAAQNIAQSSMLPRDGIDMGLLLPRLRVCTSRTSEELCSLLEVKANIPTGSFANKPTKPISYSFGDTYNTNSVVLNFSTKHTRQIDGYIRLIMKDEKDAPLWEKIIPLPMLGTGPYTNGCLFLSLPYAVRAVEIKPVALWELEDDSAPDAREAWELGSSTDDQRLSREWRANEKAHEDNVCALKRAGWKRKLPMLMGIVAIIAVVVALGFGAYWYTMFNIGDTWVHGYPQRAWDDGFSKLPTLFNTQIAEKYLQHGHYEYAEPLANERQMVRVREMQADAAISRNSAGYAYQVIVKQYEDSDITAHQAAVYAQRMYEYEPDWYSSVQNRMREDAIRLVTLLKDVDSLAAQLYSTWTQ